MKFFETYVEDTSGIQLNSDYLNLYLTNKVTVNPVKQSNDAHFFTASVSVNPRSVCAIKSTTAHIRGYIDGNQYIVYSLDSNPVTVYVFESKDATSNGNVGLLLYDANGKPIYNSNDKPLRVIDSIQVYIDNRYGDEELLNKSYAKDVAIVSSMAPLTITYDYVGDAGNTYVANYNYGAVKVHSNNKGITVSSIYKVGDRTNAYFPDLEGRVFYSVLVVDVTNY